MLGIMNYVLDLFNLPTLEERRIHLKLGVYCLRPYTICVISHTCHHSVRMLKTSEHSMISNLLCHLPKPICIITPFSYTHFTTKFTFLARMGTYLESKFHGILYFCIEASTVAPWNNNMIHGHLYTRLGVGACPGHYTVIAVNLCYSECRLG